MKCQVRKLGTPTSGNEKVMSGLKKKPNSDVFQANQKKMELAQIK